MISYRQNGNIYICIKEHDIIFGIDEVPGIDVKTHVFDKERLLDFFANQILNLGDDGDRNSCSKFDSLLDEIAKEALENCEGIEYSEVDSPS